MLCNCCEHRRLNIADKQAKKEHPYQPRMECGEPSSVCGCYMFKPVQLPVLMVNQGDRRPIGGPAMISARLRASRLTEDTGVFLVPYGPKKNKEFVFVRRPLTREEKRANDKEEAVIKKWRIRMLKRMKEQEK